MMKNLENKHLVCICCFTFNHREYIEDAMRGFVMQQTDFPYVAVVVDDASTDGEPEVIKRFLEKEFDMASALKDETDDYVRVVARHKTNDNCTFVAIFLKYNHYHKKSKKPYFQKWWDASKYIAMCEGDDYWTDPSKLQKQVDFMELTPSCSLCFHRVRVQSEDINEVQLFSDLEEKAYSSREIYDNWVIPTCSTIFPRNFFNQIEAGSPKVVYGDIYIWLQLAEKGTLFCLGFTGGVYRRHEGSLSCGYSTETCVKLFHQYQYFAKRFPGLIDISRRNAENQGLVGIIYAPYFNGIWKYRIIYMFRHPKLFFSSFFINTLLHYTRISHY